MADAVALPPAASAGSGSSGGAGNGGAGSGVGGGSVSGGGTSGGRGQPPRGSLWTRILASVIAKIRLDELNVLRTWIAYTPNGPLMSAELQ